MTITLKRPVTPLINPLRLMSTTLVLFFMITASAFCAKKNVLIIYADSTHNAHAHNNAEVAALIKYKLENSKYADQFDVKLSYKYPDDQSLLENADLIIISSDGGSAHALKKGNDLTKFTRMLDPVLKKKKTGFIVIHWATDAPSKGFGHQHKENDRLMMEWIGAVYYWVNKGKHPDSCFTIKPSPKEITVNKAHPIGNGVAEKFTLNDEFYWNFFTDGEDSRNPKNEHVDYIHTADAPDKRADANKKENWRRQSPYWAFTRKNKGRSVGMTSAHNYSSWGNKEFFQTFANSIFWTLDMKIPNDGVDISTPTKEALAQMIHATRHPVEKLKVVDVQSDGIVPIDAPNIGFELGDLSSWRVTGNAFEKQPVKGEAISERMHVDSNAQGKWFLGGYEVHRHDKGQGTMVSEPFKVTHRWATLMIGGGGHAKTRLEVIDTDSKEIIASFRGKNNETMRRVTIDLQKQIGKKIQLAIIDQYPGGWGHLNYDDFRFHEQSPPAVNAKKPPSPNHAEKLLSPEAQRQQFKLAPGFEIELVASEAMGTKKIVDIAFDTQGRMWACTASEYPADSFDSKLNFGQMMKKQGVKPTQRVLDLWEKGGIDEVLIFPNPTAQNPKKPILFGGGRALPMGILPYKNGAIVIEGPRLLFLEDTDGDNQADKKTVLAEGFGAQDTHTGAHGLKFLPGGWVSVINGVLCWGDVKDRSGKVTKFDHTGIAYIRPDGTDFHIAATGFQNIWGFYLGKNGQPWIHEANNAGYPIVPYYEKTVFPMSTPASNFYRDYMLPFPPTQNGVNLEGTALSGIEKSDDLVNGFPKEWQDRFLIAHPMPRKIHSLNVTEREDESIDISRGPDLVTSTDKNFRPVDVEFGPDGCLYIVDWYNPIISHNEVARDDPRRNKTLTRIWRVRHESQQKYRKPVNVKKASAEELLNYLTSKNSWEQESAWKEISERQDPLLIPDLAKIATNKSQIERNRIHALWSLENLNYFNAKLWRNLLGDANKHIRKEAIRALRTVQPDLKTTFPMLKKLAASEQKFIVVKELLHYMGEAKSFSTEHVTWLMQWKSTAARTYVGKAIGHEVTDWPTYIPNHYEDLVRVALEAQPAAVIASLQDSQTKNEQKQFLSEQIVPRLDNAFVLLAAGNFTVDNLDDVKTKKMIFSNLSTPKFLALAKAYFAQKSAQGQLKEVLEFQLELNEALKSMIAPALAIVLKSSESADQALYLKTAIYMNKLTGLDKLAEAEHYLTNLQIKHATLFPLGINTFIKVKKLNFDFYQKLLANTSGLSKAYAYLGSVETAGEKQLSDTLKSLRVYHNTLSLAEKSQLYTILAEYPRSLAALFTTLKDASVEEINQNYDVLFFAKERYSALVKSKQLLRLSDAGYQHVATKLKRATAVTDRMVQHKRWEKIAQSKKGNLEMGKTLFQALCLSCHKYQGEGQGIAPVLDGTGNRPLAGLISAIVNPDEGVESVYTKTHLQLHNGQHYTGLLKNENGHHYLYQMGGGKTRIPTSDISYIHRSQRSFMPDFLTKSFGDEQIADLLKYLRSMK